MKIRIADISVKELVKQNQGYCPCATIKTDDTECMCKDFREQKTPGVCHCGLYEKYNDQTKTEIAKVKGDWTEVLNDCRATVKKLPLSKEPSADFKKKILLSEHSPIRDISIKWKWQGIKSWVATHWVRHKWECYVSTQRTDRTGVDRDELPQAAPVNFTGEANAQALIDTMKKRLCRQASIETRHYAEDLKRAIHEHEPEISDVLVPSCVYRCGCAEPENCTWFDRMLEKHPLLASTDIQTRYDEYNKIFWEAHK